MATIVNNPAPATESNSGMGFLFGFILLIVLALMFFYYGVPVLQSVTRPQVSVPGQIDVNVNTPNK